MNNITTFLFLAIFAVLPACAGNNDGHDDTATGEGEGSSGGGGGEGEGSHGGGGGEGEGSHGGGEGEGEGAADDTGKTCTANGDCSNGTCLKGVDDAGNTTDFGYCTKPCESFADCPTFWNCEAVQNAVGTFCVQG